MQNTFKLVAVLGVTLVLAACGSSDDGGTVYVPVTPDPVSSKY